MVFQVFHVGVLRLLLVLIRGMDQEVEAMGIRLIFRDRMQMLFVQPDDVVYGFGKAVQKLTAFLAQDQAQLFAIACFAHHLVLQDFSL